MTEAKRLTGGWVAVAMRCAWLVLLAGMLGVGVARAQTAELRYGVLADFPPFQIWPDGGEPGGADLEMLRRLAPALQVRVTPVRYTDYASLERDLREGRLDLASSMARTPARARELAFTPAYALIDQALVMRAGEAATSLAADLSGQRLAVVSGYVSEADAAALFPLAARVPVANVDDGLRALLDGRADVLMEAQPVIVDLIERRRLAGLQIVRTLALPGGALHFAAPKARAEALASLAAALAGMDLETRQALVRHWSAQPLYTQRVVALTLDDAQRTRLARMPPLTIALVDPRLPFTAIDADGRAQGLSVELLTATLTRLGLRVAGWRATDASEALGMMQRREVDLALGLQQATSLSETLQFVGPFLEYPMVLLGPPAGTAWGLDQLVGRRLALPAVHFARPVIGARYPGIELVPCATPAACVELVSRGEAEATLTDVVSGALLLAEAPRGDMQISGAVSELRMQHGLAVAARHAALLPLLQRALDAAVASDLPELKRRWFTRPTPARLMRQFVLRVLPWVAGALALLLTAWWWHSSALRREVRRTRSAQQRAEQARAASERFTAFLAHEVRNSLHSVIAGSELLRSARRVPPSVTASLGDSARSTLSLLNNLLDRDRLEAGALSLHLEPARLEPLLKSVAVEMLPAALSKHLSLHAVTLAGDDPLLRIDGLRVQQIVRNLVSNAVKYSHAGEIVIEALSAPLADDPARCAVEVRVRDQGPGIAPGDQSRLFEPYYVVPGSASPQGGSGLGLALCRDLARLMGGDLQIDSQPGQGTTALLRWTAEAEPSAPAPAVTRARRVLIVEDAEIYAMLLERALGAHGCVVDVAGSAQQARDLLGRRDFDVVLTDQHLGDGDAYGVMAAARRPAGGGAAPTLVVMSAEIEDAHAGALREAGAQAVLKKTGDVALFVRQLLQHPALQPAA